MQRESQAEHPERPCQKCNQMRTPDGHDPCIANLPGVMNACCGHGDDEDAYVQFENGECIRGNLALIHQKEETERRQKCELQKLHERVRNIGNYESVQVTRVLKQKVLP